MSMTQDTFLSTVYDYYATWGRHDLPWRVPEHDGCFDPYRIMVSELMLQQTQVPRVVPKFEAFMTMFPDVQSVAGAPLGELLRAWQGLGYNRRAKFLWQAAQHILREHGGVVPIETAELVKLPGIGKNTAAAICAYAYNQQLLFIETNIRTVYIYHFFTNQQHVTDQQILSVLAETMDSEKPREFYWALMDYGTHLKKTVGNIGRASKAYVKQAPFEGSRRQVRGAVLRLLARGPRTVQSLAYEITDERLPEIVAELQKEGMITEHAAYFRLAA